MFARILSKLKGYLIAVGAALVALVVVYATAKKEGRNSALANQARQRADAMRAKKESDDEVDTLSPDDVDRELGRWMRDQKR
ncbi:hypothetical protein MRS76_11170 [Rhizobiaceae bacterium n13]|uniref:hypothetical protein n=1 Tax=Ferirhizobium litorale TaxID=2927786 RepID=UPI0024B2B9CB|nr:hypothetical protein [Fererhizobium litorale]MDI7862521.1 hypothetical protein [Fererhizobium litorale]